MFLPSEKEHGASIPRDIAARKVNVSVVRLITRASGPTGKSNVPLQEIPVYKVGDWSLSETSGTFGCPET